MKICSQCILPETFPGISLNTEGLCSHCQQFVRKKERLADSKREYEQRFLELVNQVVHQSDRTGQRAYDVLMAYSGGKDSSYTMSLLKNKYKLRVLAMSLDNGFVSPAAITNIKNVTDSLGIDFVFFKPRWDLLKKVFTAAAEQELYSKKTLERASTICTSCIGLVKSLCLKMAVEQDIPMIAFGWSPGQAPVEASIMKNNPSLVRMAQQAILGPLRKVAGGEIDAYFLQERHYSNQELFPYNVHPMAWEFYNEEMIIQDIKKFGWTAPADTDSNSSNCLLNAYANDLHVNRYHFHPYVWEIANMVREGVMTREEGYKKIYAKPDDSLVRAAQERLAR
jgi:hypothetical protein